MKKGFFLKLDQYERNVLQLQSEYTGLSMSELLRTHLRDSKIQKTYVMELQHTSTGELMKRERTLTIQDAELMRENIGFIYQDWILKSIFIKPDTKIENTQNAISSILSRMYKDNPLN
jgi:hypothetical protein